MQDQNVKISSMEGLIASQQALIAHQAEMMKDQEVKMTEMGKKLEENKVMMEKILLSQSNVDSKVSENSRKRTRTSDDNEEAKRQKV